MPYDREILDRKVGRNAQLFAQAIAGLDTPRDRFPYLRILIALIEKAHPEWEHAPQQPYQVVRFIVRLSGGALCQEEVTDVIKMRAEERRRQARRNGAPRTRHRNTARAVR